MKILQRSGLLIPTKYKDETSYIRIKEFLERRQVEYNRSTFTINKFYLESDQYLMIPRYFPLNQYIDDYEIEDIRPQGEDINISHIIDPRNQVQQRAIQYLMSNDNGVIQLSPGVGKTVITIYMIATRKKKTLILVHTDGLAEQWKRRIMDFTDISFDNIARLSSTTYEKDLKQPIIVSLVQTFTSLLKRNRYEFLSALHEANIGIFVGDEVHTSVGAPTFSECSIHMPTRYNYGLSATPYRYDGNSDIITFHLGDIYADEDAEDTMDANITAVFLDYGIDTAKRGRYIRWGGQFQRSRYLNMMKKSELFIKTITGLLDQIKSQRHSIIIAERINLIDQLYDKLNFPSKSRFYKSEGLSTLNDLITFATPGKCRDGIDAPWKDCIVTTSPISNIDQLSGRVLRSYPQKKTPSIIDMVDYGCYDIGKTFHSRLSFYKSKGWNINYLFVDNTGIKKIDEATAKGLLNK